MASKKKHKRPRPTKQKPPTTTTAVAVVPKIETLSLASPSQIMQFGKVLKAYIKENGLSVSIQGNDYPMVDGWKFALANFGLVALPDEPEPIHLHGQYITILFKRIEVRPKGKPAYEKEIAFFAGFQNHKEVIEELKAANQVTREIVRPYFAFKCKTLIQRLSDQVIVGKGSSTCSNLEVKKAEFDEYSVHSMSQTRSIGKASRNLLGYVMKSAGLEPTPAEEMDEIDLREQEAVISKREPKQTKPHPTEKAFKELLNRVAKGLGTTEKALESLTLTEQQVADLRAVEPKPVAA